MKRLVLGVISLVAALPGARSERENADAAAAEAAQSYAGKVVLLEAGGSELSDLAKFTQWQAALERAETDGARAVVFRIDADGGLVDRTIELAESIADLSVPTLAFVEKQALHAGAVVALAADTIYVKPGALIGGSGFVTAEGADETNQQSESVMLAKLRAVAGKQQHAKEVVEALMIPAAENKSFGGVTVSKGSVLTLTGEEAVAEFEGGTVLAKGLAESVEAMLAREGMGEAEVIEPAAVKVEEPAVVPPDERRGVSRTADEQGKPSKTPEEESFEGKIVVLSVGQDDLMNKQSFKFWRRMLRRAEEENAKAIIFDLDTPGGRAFETSDLMTELTRLKVPSYAFVNPNAISAGALVSVATDAIYVSPDAKIGAAGLVSSMGEIENMMRKKLHSVFEAQLRSVAEKKGHDPELIRAMMIPDENKDRVFGEVTVPKGTLLTLTAKEAVSLRGGKPLLAEAIVTSVEEIADLEGLEGVPIVRPEPTPFERFAWWVAKYSFLLILVGMGAAYAEMNAPGFGIGGAISLAAFATFFFGNYVAGNLAGYEMAALFVLGVILILVEIFLIPGTGLAGIAGVLCVGASLLFGMVDKVEWGDWRSGEFSGNLLDLLRGPVLSLGAGLLGGSILVLILMRYLPSVPIFRFLVVEKELAGGASLPDTAAAGHAERVGWTGTALTDLRPAGKAMIGDEAMDVVAVDGGYIPKGANLRIVEEDGMRVVVTQIEAV